MRFSHQVHYAIYGVFDLAYNGRGKPVQVRVISERQSIPTRYLEQIFQRLRRGGIVKGKRGPGGGYELATDPENITLRKIVEAVEGPIGGGRSPGQDEASGDEIGASSAQPSFVWLLLADRIRDLLDDFSVAELCRIASLQGVPRAGSEAQDYQI
ncbi:MAG: Rrf2 family transcriptional regulator [Myxococcota bacterium]|jgi:Rrf2 family transcriptional regulator, iron-sulfur cluster assembly transcription factor|nr:Rrf2 family transcriptional regulator [Myxococcota bacterium]